MTAQAVRGQQGRDLAVESFGVPGQGVAGLRVSGGKAQRRGEERSEQKTSWDVLHGSQEQVVRCGDRGRGVLPRRRVRADYGF